MSSALAVESQPLKPPAGTPFFMSGTSATWSSDPTQPSTATGGVEARYEGIYLNCDHLSLHYAALAGTTTNIPNEGALQPGAAGPKENRVVLDTREATAPTIGFRGLFTPASVAMKRLVDPSLPPLHVRYQVDLPDAGDFQGLLKMQAGWAPFRGWADNIQLIIGAEVISGSLSNMRVLKITLNGRPVSETRPQRNAEINRLKADIPIPAPEQPLTVEMVSGHNDARVIYLEFDDQGRPGTHWEGKNNVWGTDLNLFNMTADGKKSAP